MDISSDTEIFDAREFFIRGKDPQKAALACFYAAFVATEQNQTTTGMEYYQEALDFAKNTDNKELQIKILYNMGYLNYRGGWYDDAIKRYLQSLNISQLTDNQNQLEVRTLNSIASVLMMMNNADSAQYYYQQALDQAQLHEDIALQVMIYNNMSMTYRVQGQPDQATFFSRQALQLAINDNDKMYIYSNLAYVHHETGSADSARYYIQLAEELSKDTDNNLTTAYLAELSYQIEKSEGNYQKALEYFELNSKLQFEVLENNDRKVLLEMQKKYDMTIKENALNQQRNKAWKFAGVSLMFLLALAVFCIFILRINMKQKEALAREKLENTEKQLALEQAERKSMEKTMELEHVLHQAQTLQEMYNQRDNEMKTIFLEKIGILKKIALLSPYLNEKSLNAQNEELKLMKRTREIVKYLDLQNFIDTANELYPEFTDRLKQVYSSLDDREISICCLLLFDFNNQELDLFLNRRLKSTLNTIQKWKSVIRRKLDMDSHGDIKEHLLRNIVGSL
jgi:tetratricopeptide (TPR) repeat protein